MYIVRVHACIDIHVNTTSIFVVVTDVYCVNVLCNMYMYFHVCSYMHVTLGLQFTCTYMYIL